MTSDRHDTLSVSDHGHAARPSQRPLPVCDRTVHPNRANGLDWSLHTVLWSVQVCSEMVYCPAILSLEYPLAGVSKHRHIDYPLAQSSIGGKSQLKWQGCTVLLGVLAVQGTWYGYSDIPMVFPQWQNSVQDLNVVLPGPHPPHPSPLSPLHSLSLLPRPRDTVSICSCRHTAHP